MHGNSLSDEQLASILYAFVNRLSRKDIDDIYTSVDLCNLAAANSGTPMQLLRDKQQQEILLGAVKKMLGSDKSNLTEIIVRACGN